MPCPYTLGLPGKIPFIIEHQVESFPKGQEYIHLLGMLILTTVRLRCVAPYFRIWLKVSPIPRCSNTPITFNTYVSNIMYIVCAGCYLLLHRSNAVERCITVPCCSVCHIRGITNHGILFATERVCHTLDTLGSYKALNAF